MATSYNALEPSYFSSTGITAPTFDANQPVSLFASTSFLYSLAIMICVVAAGIMYAKAGLWRMEASERGVTKSNEIFKRTTFGLLLILSMFTLIYTINPDLLTGDVSLQNFKVSPFGSGVTPAPGAARGDVNPSDPSGGTPGTGSGSEQENRAALSALGISVNKSACTAAQMNESRPSCTNVGGLGASVIPMLTQLKNSCPGASITVTGGTEPGHKSHGVGKNAIDLRIGNSTLDACIRRFPTPVQLGWCKATYSGLGFVFCDEKGTGHWHVFK